MRRFAAIPVAAGILEAQQSALDPAGPYARRIISMGTVFVVLLGLIFLVVVVLALVPLLRRHRGIGQEPLEETHRPSAGTERRMAVAVGIATAMTVVILFGLVVLSVSMGRTAGAPLSRPNSIAVEVTGNQWWWQIRYLNDNPRMVFTTANEMHIPVGLPILIRGTSHDVIHSFWIPGLQGKRDLIPSRITTEWIQADRPGHFRGQCAEFCGLQHAHMAMWVVAEPKEQFRNWLARQLQPAVAPGDSARQRGQQVFLESACALCHSIQGTDAGGQSGPDLTHFGSRLTIAAGTLPNTPGNLAGWIADPENVKPGNHMATVPVASEDLQPLVEYLESLQ